MWRRGAEQKRQLGTRRGGRPRIDLISKLDLHERLSGHQRRTSHDSPARHVEAPEHRFQLRWIWGSGASRSADHGRCPSGRRWPNSNYSSTPASRRRTYALRRTCAIRRGRFRAFPHPQVRAAFAPRDPAHQEEIPEGRLRDATYRRDAIYRRTLALADVASAAIAVLIGVPILGEDALNPVALLALPLVLVVGKVTGLYDRDEHLIRKTTLDEVPALFWVATLYALLIWLGWGPDRRWPLRP